MGLLERLDELDRRMGLAGGARPTAATWALAAVTVTALTGVLLASSVERGVLRTAVTVTVLLAAMAWTRRAESRGGRDGPIRAVTILFVIALVLMLPAALMGFWQGPLLLLTIGAITLLVLIRTR